MKTHPVIKFYIYLRKSSESEERQIQSIERQADEVQKLVSQLNLHVVGIFQESRSAMAPYNRPEFTKMIKGIKAGKANGIICWHMSRLARNPLESGIVQQLLEDGKIQRIITKDREYTSADNAIIFSVESSLATQYSKDLGRMVRSGTEKKVNMGIAPLKAPVGYLNTKLPEHGSNYIIKDPKRFDTVRRIWDLMLTETHSPAQILAIITTEMGLDVASGAQKKKIGISRATLYRILTNPFYAGMFLFKSKLHKGVHPAMITLSEYNKVQEMLGRTGRPRPQKKTFAYTGMMICPGCGSAITATEKIKRMQATGFNKSYIYYYCTNRKVGANCTLREPIRLDELEEQIQEELSKVSVAPSFLGYAKKVINENISEVANSESAILDAHMRQLESIKKEIATLLQLRIANTVTDEEYRQEKEKRENNIAVIEKAIQETHMSPVDIFKEVENKLEGLVNLKERFINASVEGKKKIFSYVGENCSLIGKKLNISKPRWLLVVEKYQKEVEAEISWWELNKYVDIPTFDIHFSGVFLTLRRLIDEVGKEVVNEKTKIYQK